MKRTGIALIIIVIVSIAATALFAGCDKNKTGKASSGNIENKTDATGVSGEEGTLPSEENEVSVFFVKGENACASTRVTEGGALGALTALLGGPNESEKAQGYETAIPEEVQINNYKVEGGTAKVDFSGELLDYGGGSARVEAIINQIERTILENDPSVKSVEITVNGVPSSQCLQP